MHVASRLLPKIYYKTFKHEKKLWALLYANFLPFPSETSKHPYFPYVPYFTTFYSSFRAHQK